MTTLPIEARHRLSDIMFQCRNSTKAMALRFFPHHFNRQFEVGHDAIFNTIDSDSQLIAIAAPRGIGKTTITTIPFISRHILFGLSHYVLVVGASQDAAMEQTESLKNELLNNDDICRLFGSVKSSTFAQTHWDIEVGKDHIGRPHHMARVMPVGPWQKIRGRKFFHYRPDLLVVDDLENDENVDSEDQRHKLEFWFNAALRNSVDRGSPFWKLVMIGTILHHDSLLANIVIDEKLRYRFWTKLRLSICTNEYKSLWPKFISDDAVMRLVEEHRHRDAMAQFGREYMNEPVPDEERKFRREYFKYYNADELNLNANPNVVSAVLMDPAKTISQGSCYTAVICVGVDCSSGRIYVREVSKGKMSPDDQIHEALSMVMRNKARILAVEVTSLNEFITHPIYNELSRIRLPLEVLEIKPRDKKEKRSGGLVPYYKQGFVYHNDNGCCKNLEDNLVNWPRPSDWDSIDALGNIIPAMEQGRVYFYPPALDEGSPDSEYESLYKKQLEEDGEINFRGVI